MPYLYYGHFKKQTWLWGFSATESNYPPGWLRGLCVLEKAHCLSTTVHLPKETHSQQSHKQAQSKFLFLWTCIPDLSLVGAPRASAYRPQGLTRWAEPILGIPWQFEKRKPFDKSHRLGYTCKKGTLVFVSKRQFQLIFWFSILKNICSEGLLQTHAYTYGLVKLSGSKAKQNKKDLIVRKELLGRGLKGWFIYA